MRVNGCGLLSAGPSSSCRLKLRWRRFVSATNEAMTVDLKGNGLDEFVLEFDNDVGVIDLDADEGTQQVEKNRENWIRALQQVLNECRDMVVFAKRINRISSVLKILTSLETQLNEPGNLINGVRLATVIPKSLTWPIPFFTQLQQGAPVQQRNTFVSSLSDYLRGQNCSPETRLKPIINGLLFTSNAQQLILTRAVTHLDIMASLEWLSAKAAVLTNTRVKEEVQQLKIIFTAPTRAAGWLVSADRNWLLSIKRHTGYRNVTGGFEVSDSDLNKFTIYLNGKVRALVPSTPNMRVVLQAFMNFAELPDIVLNDLNKLGNDLESKPLGGAVGLQARPEWCITMPPGGPSHLPAEGMTCFIVESDVGRISLVVCVSISVHSSFNCS
ncbi:hypothetical protein BC830DRAFT_610556 [Chytriomyces sp. MP71]|nr:hypothetical protein BC830DRAFT_610556 [Chytriomyces sp. MP71]